MSPTLLYHGFGVRDYRHVKTKFVAGGIRPAIERRHETRRWSACSSANVRQQGAVARRFRTG